MCYQCGCEPCVYVDVSEIQAVRIESCEGGNVRILDNRDPTCYKIKVLQGGDNVSITERNCIITISAHGDQGPQGPEGPPGPGSDIMDGTCSGQYLVWDDDNSVWKVEGNKIHLGCESGTGDSSPVVQGVNSISIGENSRSGGMDAIVLGYEAQGLYDGEISIGKNSGSNSGVTGIQNSITIGNRAGKIRNGFENIAVGEFSGLSQNDRSIAMGSFSGTEQSGSSIALGYKAGFVSQMGQSLAIGRESGGNQSSAIAIGYQAGITQQEVDSVAIGQRAATCSSTNTQGTQSVVVGSDAGKSKVAAGCISVGYKSGRYQSGTKSISIGYEAGDDQTGTNSIAIGTNAGKEQEDDGNIAIGTNAGDGQENGSIAIGKDSGHNQTDESIAIGNNAGQNQKISSNIAIGKDSGKSQNQGGGIAIGIGSGDTQDGKDCVAIGTNSGAIQDGKDCIAIGTNSGIFQDGANCISIGKNSGSSSSILETQGGNSIAIGVNSANNGQGSSSIAIGKLAGAGSKQADNCIVINATGVAIPATELNTFIVAPVRQKNDINNILMYDVSNKEIYYGHTTPDNFPKTWDGIKRGGGDDWTTVVNHGTPISQDGTDSKILILQEIHSYKVEISACFMSDGTGLSGPSTGKVSISLGGSIANLPANNMIIPSVAIFTQKFNYSNFGANSESDITTFNAIFSFTTNVPNMTMIVNRNVDNNAGNNVNKESMLVVITVL